MRTTQAKLANVESLAKQLETDKPELVCVQLDPMPYLWRARNFALENMNSV